LYWRILRRGKWKLALVAYAGMVATVLLTLPQTALYLGRTSIEIQPLNEDFLNLRQMSPVHESAATDANLGDIPTQVEILRSDTLLAGAAARISPIPKGTAVPASLARSRSTWRAILHLPKSKILTPQEAALAREVGSLKVKAIPDTRIVEVSCDSPDPKVAAGFVNAVAEEYIQQNLEVRWQMSQRTGEWLSTQLEDMRVKLKTSETALQSYARDSGLIVAARKQHQNPGGPARQLAGGASQGAGRARGAAIAL